MDSKSWTRELQDLQHLKSVYVIDNAHLYKELDSLIASKDEVVALLYSRRALEVVVTEICTDKLSRERGNEPLLSIIDRLVKEKYIPEFIHSAMHNLNRNATYGAHPKDFDSRQVRTAVIDLHTILDWYFIDKQYKQIVKIDLPNTAKTQKQSELKNISDTTVNPDVPKRPNLLMVIAIVTTVVATSILIVMIGRSEIRKPKDESPKKEENKEIRKPNVEINDPGTFLSNRTDKNSGGASEKGTVEAAKSLTQPQNNVKQDLQKSNKVFQVPSVNVKAKADIDRLFKQLTNPKIAFTERKIACQQLIAEFETNAVISISMNSKVVDRMAASDYVSRLLVLNGIEVNILKQQKTNTGKIKMLEVEEVRNPTGQ